jgi:hypothetical protein
VWRWLERSSKDARHKTHDALSIYRNKATKGCLSAGTHDALIVEVRYLSVSKCKKSSTSTCKIKTCKTVQTKQTTHFTSVLRSWHWQADCPRCPRGIYPPGD